MRPRRYGDISVSVAKLLLQLRYHGAAKLHATRWIIQQNGRTFQHKTIAAAYERCLIKIVLEAGRRHRRRQTVELTEIGEVAALGVEQRARQRAEFQGGVSEGAALLIQSIISECVPGEREASPTKRAA